MKEPCAYRTKASFGGGHEVFEINTSFHYPVFKFFVNDDGWIPWPRACERGGDEHLA